MTEWLYTARKRFTTADTDRWAEYVAWIGFSHIDELVSLDHMLCGEIIDELNQADWLHNVQLDFCTTWFRDIDYLRKRCEWRIGRDQILAMIETPVTEHSPPPGFSACGFDILDRYDSISVLTNCGCFPGVIEPETVNCWGLVPQIATANAIADTIRVEFPDDPHCCECRVWQVARDADPGK